MMIINPQRHPTVDIPPWDPPYEDQTDTLIFSPQTQAYFTTLHRYLPSSTTTESNSELDSDSFRMYEFKVRKCPRVRSHDWTECPFAHPGEKARRRDPRRREYSAVPCPEFRRGSCRKGDSCEFAHGVFESWLHPTRYRTQPCNDGRHCRRRVCFFAHSHDELRVVAESDSPPSFDSVGELVGAIRGLQIRGLGLPSSPGYLTRSGLGTRLGLERVESGRELRARMHAKLMSKENSLDWGRVDSENVGPDFGWVSELVN